MTRTIVQPKTQDAVPLDALAALEALVVQVERSNAIDDHGHALKHLKALADARAILRDHAAAQRRESPLPANRFDCPTCGQGIGVDDDGCCRTCGAEATVVVAASDATVPPRPQEAKTYTEAEVRELMAKAWDEGYAWIARDKDTMKDEEIDRLLRKHVPSPEIASEEHR
jgi:hypothetical protein